jgi:UDP-N-acetylmuramoyl-tripeptide--D-alanyl-D-alanine ligase
MSAQGSRPVVWTAAQAASAVGHPQESVPWQATGVAIDSRTVEPGDLFVALKGPNFDGHDFVPQAFAAGAAAALVARKPAGLPETLPLLPVADTLTALQDLGQAARRRSQARIIAVTGSVGKTGTKEALAACLSAQAACHATAGSLNNHWGVPLSLARLTPECRYAVFELGMNHAGEIGPLARLVRPDVGVITTIEPAHMAFFTSLEAVADAKAELFEGMGADGVALLNRDNGQFDRLQAAARASRVGDIRCFGSAAGADARLIECTLHATSSDVTAVISGVRLQYTLSLPGRHWVNNSLAVLLAVQAAGADVPAAALTLGSLVPVKGRGTRRLIALAQGRLTLIDESYNASPAAMEAAFQVLGRTGPGPGGRRIAALGDMLELGDRAEVYHAGLAGPLLAAGIDLVFCCGSHMGALFHSLPSRSRGGFASDSTGLAPMVAASVRGGDVVLVKGSAGSKMARVTAALVDLEGDAARPAASTAAAA